MTQCGRTGLYFDRWYRLSRCPGTVWWGAPAAMMLLLFFSFNITSANATFAPKDRAKEQTHVYLIRGLLNIFSLGMDDLAAKLEREGIPASVHNHLAWPLVAAEAASEYKSGRVRTIILVGHSAGADAVANIAAKLGQEGIPVKLAISLDPGLSHMPASGHVERYINYYVSTGIGHTIAKSPQFRGNFQNVDVANLAGIGHFNIDKAAVMEDKVMRDIHAAL
jgi:hypothetical protein